MEYRIIRSDPMNWTIQQKQEAGQPITRGRYAGQLTQERWMDDGHYPSLKEAATALLDKAAGDAMLTEVTTSILDAIERAKLAVLATLAVQDMGVKQPERLTINVEEEPVPE